MKGVRSEILSKSSMVMGMSNSCAMAMRCSTALVDPPEAQTAAMAFSMRLARDDLRRTDAFAGEVHDDAAGLAARPRAFSADMAGTPEIIMGEMPRNSPAMAMVLAVNWPPQAPGPGQAAASSCSSCSSLILPAACAPMPSKT